MKLFADATWAALPGALLLAAGLAGAQPALADTTAGTAAPVAAAARPALLPAEVFFKPADIGDVQLSPSGRKLALTSGHLGGRRSLVVFDLHEWGKLNVVARYADADIRSFDWVNDNRLVYDVIDLKAGGGDQRFAAGLFAVDADGSGQRVLVQLTRPFVTEHRVGREPLPWNHGLLHVPEDGSDEVIVGEYNFAGNGDLRNILPKRLHVGTGRARTLALGAPDDTFGWWFDASGRPRLLLSTRDGRHRLMWRKPDKDNWELLAEYDRFKAPFEPRYFDAAGSLFVTVAAGEGGHDELRTFDFEHGAPKPEALVRTPGFDFNGRPVTEHAGGVTLGIRLVTDAEQTVWFDPRLKALQQETDKRLPGRVNRLSCRRCQAPDMTVLLESFSDQDPGFLQFYRADTQQWKLIGRRRPAVDPAQMAQVDFHRIKARDGLDLPVWVTTPRGPAAGPRPAVVLVHGGPWVRGGHWGWSAMGQFLASRGYVVIEPEFRGSAGYGETHLRASFKQWGLAMQDDVADALQWAVGKGWADGQRSCIAGASYGGYATLMGLVRHPELYRCGAAWVAVTDVQLMFSASALSDLSDEVRKYSMPTMIGDPKADAEQLRATSPVHQAAKIKAPVLLAFGGEDRRVPLAHGTSMRDALVKAGNPPEWVVYPDEAHGWLQLETRIDFARRLEQFLARHLQLR